MTVIAALALDGKVHMASDTGSQMDGSIFYGPHKVFTLPVANSRDLAALGFAGTATIGALVYAHLDIAEAPADDAEARAWHRWAVAIAMAVCDIAAEARPNALDSDGWVNGCGILGYRGRLWLLAQQEATPVTTPFVCCGSGGDLATGVLATLPGDLMPAREQLEEAVSVACRFDAGCSIDHDGMRYVAV